ncbi:MAG: hypothetical protein M3R06_06700 [Chloroflexota bacterium]|nr:hypothetical protein [Chloroflexota bacterium]
MSRLNSIALTMTIGGFLLIALALAFDLPPGVILAGILLAWAGIVKVIVVALWKGVASLNRADGRDGTD